MTRKELGLLLASVLLTIAVGLGIIRWMSPQLFRAPTDSQVVRLSKELPAFYETVFHNPAEKDTADFLVNDPITLVRARPLAPGNMLFGPHDVLGFRNRLVPQVAPVVVVGDSQTYGNNAPIEANWPNQMRRHAGLPPTSLYSMATGGWGAVQYLNMFTLAGKFHPRVVIVAYYTGNDPLESFKAAYALDQWRSLRPDPALKLSDLPNVPFPAPDSETWKADFRDGSSMVYTPRLRFYSNDPKHPAVVAGYGIMGETARIMDEAVTGTGSRLVFTVIPTKELAYSLRTEAEGLTPPPAYHDLIAHEMQHIEKLRDTLSKLPNSRYVDVVGPLRQSALKSSTLYPADKDGHPLPDGYAVIGETIAGALSDLQRPQPGVAAVMGPDKSYQLYLITAEGAWDVLSESMLEKNGWGSSANIATIEERDLALLPRMGPIPTVDPARFGPH